MIYAMGSKLFKAVVVLAAGTQACGSNCSHNNDHTSTGHGGKAHDLADAGEDEHVDIADVAGENVDGGDAKDEGENPFGGLMGGMGGGDMGGMEEMMKMLQGLGGGEGGDNMDLAKMMQQLGESMKGGEGGETTPTTTTTPAPQEESPEVTEEQFLEVKEKLNLNDDDMAQVMEYVKQVPEEFKDPSFTDDSLAKMFVYHYFTGEDEAAKEGELENQISMKSKDALMEELRTLVEVEIPEMQKHMEQQKQASVEEAKDMDAPEVTKEGEQGASDDDHNEL